MKRKRNGEKPVFCESKNVPKIKTVKLDLLNKKDLNKKEISYDEYIKIGKCFSDSAKKHNMTVQTCAEDFNLVEFGFIKNDCLSKELAKKVTGKNFKKWKARKHVNCNCVEMVDIGEYNSCNHLCKYCYANFNENMIRENIGKHNKNSSLLLGELNEKDIVTIRKDS